MKTPVQTFTVTSAEAGQKLLQYLARRLGSGPPPAALQRFIRTGQVRLDGKRCKPGTTGSAKASLCGCRRMKPTARVRRSRPQPSPSGRAPARTTGERDRERQKRQARRREQARRT